jgi:OmpA-OmpF porin, OOP family
MVGKCIVLVAFAASVFAQLPVATIPKADRKGSKDSPLLKRYEGSFIVAYEHKSFGELTLPLSRLEVVPEKKTQQNNRLHEPKNKKALEGAHTRIAYLIPADRSPLEVLRNYQDDIKSKGERYFTNARLRNAAQTLRAAAEAAAETRALQCISTRLNG